MIAGRTGSDSASRRPGAQHPSEAGRVELGRADGRSERRKVRTPATGAHGRWPTRTGPSLVGQSQRRRSRTGTAGHRLDCRGRQKGSPFFFSTFYA